MARFYALKRCGDSNFGLWNNNGEKLSNFVVRADAKRYGPPADDPSGTPDWYLTMHSEMMLSDGSIARRRFEMLERDFVDPAKWINRHLGAEARWNNPGDALIEAVREHSANEYTFPVRTTTVWNEADGLYHCGRRLTDTAVEIVEERQVDNGDTQYRIRATKNGQTAHAWISHGDLISGRWTDAFGGAVRALDPIRCIMALREAWVATTPCDRERLEKQTSVRL